MVEKIRVVLTMQDFYDAIRLYVFDERKIKMPINRSSVSMLTDEDKALIFEWDKSNE